MGSSVFRSSSDNGSEKTKKKDKNAVVDPITKEWRLLTREDRQKFQEQDSGQFITALSIENIDKNRYQSVLAPDNSRVKLSFIDGRSDYINANYVDGIHKDAQNAYIATQAPRTETMEDFWRMIWEQKVTVIVMLTNLEEGGRVKAHQYWPKAGTQKYGCMSVTLNSTEESGDFCFRTFTISQGLSGGLKFAKTDTQVEKRKLYQYHFQSWPDMGVPTDFDPILHMMQVVDKQHNSSGPLVVHCSAGIGRTGTYIVIHSVLKKFREENIYTIDGLVLQEILSKMRDQRPGFVQQKTQYIFCYECIKHALASMQKAIDNHKPVEDSTDEQKETTDSSDEGDGERHVE